MTKYLVFSIQDNRYFSIHFFSFAVKNISLPSPICPRQVFCERLSGDKTTKLQIKDRSSNIVRFRQGGTLWEVEKNGDTDITNGRCEYSTLEPGDDDDDDDGDYFRAKNMASNMVSKDLCIKGSTNTRLDDCGSSNDKLKWKINDGRLYTKNDPHGCLYAEDDGGNERVKYDEDCDNRDYAEWEYTDKKQIKLKGKNFCVTYNREGGEKPSEDDRMIIRPCRDIPRFRYALI